MNRTVILTVFLVALLFSVGCARQTNMADVHTNYISLKHEPILNTINTWCGDGIFLSLSDVVSADTISYNSVYAANYWVWVGPKSLETFPIKTGRVYKVKYQILGSCLGVAEGAPLGVHVILVNLLTWEEVKPNETKSE